jgi:putative FmdB family regulatory protein
MPRYDYKCNSCNIVTELLLSINDLLEEQKCNKCNNTVLRVYSPIPAIFKGSGFYKTDNGGKK